MRDKVLHVLFLVVLMSSVALLLMQVYTRGFEAGRLDVLQRIDRALQSAGCSEASRR